MRDSDTPQEIMSSAWLYAIINIFFYIGLPVILPILFVIFYYDKGVWEGLLWVSLVIFIVIISASWRLKKLEIPGIQKTKQDMPRFFKLIEDVAQAIQTEAVSQVYFTPGFNASVIESGGLLASKGRAKILLLGIALLEQLKVGELKAILAHEHAHFRHKDTFSYRFIHGLDTIKKKVLAGMNGSSVNLRLILLMIYWDIYSMIVAHFMRKQEFLADKIAAEIYGTSILSDALEKVRTILTIIYVKRKLNTLTLVSARLSLLSDVSTEIKIRLNSLLDSHPHLKSRIKRLADNEKEGELRREDEVDNFDNLKKNVWNEFNIGEDEAREKKEEESPKEETFVESIIGKILSFSDNPRTGLLIIKGKPYEDRTKEEKEDINKPLKKGGSRAFAVFIDIIEAFHTYMSDLDHDSRRIIRYSAMILLIFSLVYPLIYIIVVRDLFLIFGIITICFGLLKYRIQTNPKKTIRVEGGFWGIINVICLVLGTFIFIGYASFSLLKLSIVILLLSIWILKLS